ncbi:c2H2-type domain-containing protein [Nephila pilipes]|uniref:C2H2-type domain-containing protein n=1 Tax=Nephila pilipes TaxID=299642 RepID=A0A8X6TGT5_NEPPI|nr:c2H2-type domain-containing protein [Nephila pilipes]
MQQSFTTFYRHLKKLSHAPVRCPQYGQRMTMDQFYHHHASVQHHVQSRKQCIFCFGAKSWAHGEKKHTDNVKHISDCLQRFLNGAGNASSWREDDTCECQKFESTPHQMFGRLKERMNEYVGFYDSVFEKHDWWRCDNPVEFIEASGFGKDVYGILQHFTRGDLVWLNLVVKHDAFETFCKEMEKIRDQFVLLPFWCLCNGMKSGTG